MHLLTFYQCQFASCASFPILKPARAQRATLSSRRHSPRASPSQLGLCQPNAPVYLLFYLLERSLHFQTLYLHKYIQIWLCFLRVFRQIKRLGGRVYITSTLSFSLAAQQLNCIFFTYNKFNNNVLSNIDNVRMLKKTLTNYVQFLRNERQRRGNALYSVLRYNATGLVFHILVLCLDYTMQELGDHTVYCQLDV